MNDKKTKQSALNKEQVRADIEVLLLAWGAAQVVVINNSHLHEGHAGAKSGGGHYAARVVAEQFTGLSRIKRHRLVYAQVNELFASGAIHALEVEALTPEEVGA